MTSPPKSLDEIRDEKAEEYGYSFARDECFKSGWNERDKLAKEREAERDIYLEALELIGKSFVELPIALTQKQMFEWGVKRGNAARQAIKKGRLAREGKND